MPWGGIIHAKIRYYVGTKLGKGSIQELAHSKTSDARFRLPQDDDRFEFEFFKRELIYKPLSLSCQ